MKIRSMINRIVGLLPMLILSFYANSADGMEIFYSDSRIFVVFLVVLVILIGLFIYLFRIDKKVKSLEEQLKNSNED